MKLSQLSNQELEARLKELVVKERKILHVILEHIKEVDTRRLYLERAYSSIYDYLVKELNYSGSAAKRRLEAARLLKDVPAVAHKIQEGSLNLSQIGELSRAIKESEKTTGLKVSAVQKNDLISAISGKTTQQTQKELSVALDIEIKEREKQRTQKDESVRVEFTLSKIQYQKLSRCKDLAAHLLEQSQMDLSWASVIEVLSDQYLNKKEFTSNARQTGVHAEPTVQVEPAADSRSKLKAEPVVESKNESTIETIAASETEGVIASLTPNVNKSLTSKVRRKILDRDKCCQFTDPETGRKCGSTFKLQIDHRTSQWAGGGHAESNLQAFCKMHNQLKYRKEARLRFA